MKSLLEGEISRVILSITIYTTLKSLTLLSVTEAVPVSALQSLFVPLYAVMPFLFITILSRKESVLRDVFIYALVF